MGREVMNIVSADPSLVLAGCIGRHSEGDRSEVHRVLGNCDVIIDFTTGNASATLAEICADHAGPALVIGSTGFEVDDLARIRAASEKLAIVRSGNFSLGINLLMGLVERSARALPQRVWDIEIHEAHHRRKIDAPSGTALMLGDAAAEGRQISLSSVARYAREFTLLESVKSSVYLMRFENVWDRLYLGATKTFDTSLIDSKIQFDYYRTKAEADSAGGKINQEAYGLTYSPTYKNHSLKFALQQINGNEYFDYIAESNAITLPNTMMSYYNGPNERSYQISYINDLAAYGLPGLKSTLWYIKGWGIDGAHYDGGSNGMYSGVLQQTDESHYEIGGYLNYTIQSGALLKNSNIASGYSIHRASKNQIDGNTAKFRIIINVPIKIL